MCKCGNAFSLPVLIGREAWPYFFIPFAGNVLPVFFTLYTVFGGDGEEETPVPIPNTEVKLFSADGTAWGTTWESRTPPRSFKAKSLLEFPRGFLLDDLLSGQPLLLFVIPAEAGIQSNTAPLVPSVMEKDSVHDINTLRRSLHLFD